MLKEGAYQTFVDVIVIRTRSLGGRNDLRARLGLVGSFLAFFHNAPPIKIYNIARALRAVRGARRFHSDIPQLIPVMAATIQVHLLTGVLLSIGYVAAKALS